MAQEREYKGDEINELLYAKAAKRVQEIKILYTHLFMYIFVNISLLTINIALTPGRWWFYWSSIFWGLGVLGHFLVVVVLPDFMNKEWEENKIQELISHYSKTDK